MHAFQDTALALEDRVNDLLGCLTAEEKIGWLPSRQKAVERLGIDGYHAGQEGAHGVVDRSGGKATVFPQPQGLSFTWDTELMRGIGEVIGDEARGFYDAVNHRSFLHLFFPTIDMERDPRWGRNEEAYGEDPFLAGKLSAALIRGVQGEDPFYVKAVATPKHFYANNFERDRSFTSSVISERLKHEYYLRVFGYAFEEGKALSVMTAYNQINGVPGMLNGELNTVLRDKWGCEGSFVTDGGAFKQIVTEHRYFETHAESLAAALKAGIDVFLDEAELVEQSAREALERGLITMGDIDNAIGHTLRVRFRLGQFDVDGDNSGAAKTPYAGITKAVICSEQHSRIAKKAAEEAVVLLKNDGLLPLNREKTKTIAVIGQLGGENMPDWYSGYPPYEVTPLEGMEKAFPNSKVLYADGCDTCAFYSEKAGKWLRALPDGSVALNGGEADRAVFRVSEWGYGGFVFREQKSGKYLTTTEDGTLACTADAPWGWFVRELFFCEKDRFLPDARIGSGTEIGVAMRRGNSVYNKPYKDGAVEKVNEVLTQLAIVRLKDGLAEAAETAKGADAAVVVVGNHTLIGARECIDRETLDLPERMASLVARTAEANPRTTLCLIAGGPYTLAAQEKIVPVVLYTAHGAQEIGSAIGGALAGDFSPAGRLSMTWYADTKDFPDINDYDIIKNKRTYLYYDKPVLHPFGYGLSYTAFSYSGFSLSLGADGIEARFTVKNTGQRAGDEVPQLYFASSRRDLDRPLKQLCGFERVHLAAGEEKQLVFQAPFTALAYYDEQSGGLLADKAEYRFMVGASSEDIRLTETVDLR
ncbi:glucan 1,4-alpha-glucosidase [Spirochaetia bacterium]|nr:glucan 1,4-alpha-glucosidase [Spirochaetia bacterium]